MDELRLLYGWVKRTRAVVFDYALGLPDEIYTAEHEGFGFGSIRNLQVHVAECYLWWVGHVGLGQTFRDLNPYDLTDVTAVQNLFERVDLTVETALSEFTNPDALYSWGSGPNHPSHQISQRWLILHPITHEFNHKGQMLSLGRILGHPVPPTSEDTDLALP
jgi:uncharacterized damage-inducible protein DinB